MKTFIGASLIMAISLSSQAFTLNSSTNPNLKGWAGGEVQIFVNTANCPAGVDVIGLTQEAVKIWNNVPTSSIKVSYGGTTTNTGSSTNPPTVYCSTNFASIPGGPDPDAVPGAASVSSPGGQIAAGQIFLNATSGDGNVGNFSYTALLIIMAHEIGHLLGLGHSHSTSALMYYDASAKDTYSLSQDDIDGISYLYPSNEFSDNKFAGCGSVGFTAPPLPPSASGGAMALFLLMLFPIGTWYLLRMRVAKSTLPVS